MEVPLSAMYPAASMAVSTRVSYGEATDWKSLAALLGLALGRAILIPLTKMVSLQVLLNSTFTDLLIRYLKIGSNRVIYVYLAIAIMCVI